MERQNSLVAPLGDLMLILKTLWNPTPLLISSGFRSDHGNLRSISKYTTLLISLEPFVFRFIGEAKTQASYLLPLSSLSLETLAGVRELF